MGGKQRFIWEIYFLVILLFTIRDTFEFFDPNSQVFLYFYILKSFDIHFYGIYLFNLLRVILNVLHFLPLALFIYKKRLFRPNFWRILFFLKIAFDMFGHSYELNIIRSLWYHDVPLALGIFFSSIVIYIPAYVALFMYAFMQKSLKLKEF